MAQIQRPKQRLARQTGKKIHSFSFFLYIQFFWPLTRLPTIFPSHIQNEHRKHSKKKISVQNAFRA